MATTLPAINLGLTISDPVTAISVGALGAFTAWCNYLCTPSGQKLGDDINKLTLDRLVALLPK